MAAKWIDTIPIDDEAHPRRQLGDKTILQVPENHVAGGFRIGKTGEEDTDQEFVLFSQGRHVLPDCKYYGIEVRRRPSRKTFILNVLERKAGVTKQSLII